MLLKALNYDLDIDACLLTHEHQDHACAIKQVMAAGIDVYSSAGTFGALGVNGNRRAKAIPAYVGIFNMAFYNYGFPIIHDAVEPFGYIIHEEDMNEYLLFVPDSGLIKQQFNIKFDIIAIECSYDIEILQHRVDTQDINESLAKRLLNSHMRKQTTLNYLSEFCDLSKCRQIHLLHMSSDNIDKKATKKEFEKKLFTETVTK